MDSSPTKSVAFSSLLLLWLLLNFFLGLQSCTNHFFEFSTFSDLIEDLLHSISFILLSFLFVRLCSAVDDDDDDDDDMCLTSIFTSSFYQVSTVSLNYGVF